MSQDSIDIFMRMLRDDFGGGMKRVAITCGAVAIALACIAPKPAAAGDNFVPALFGGLALGSGPTELSNAIGCSNRNAYATAFSIRSNPLGRHGRACSGHPRLQCRRRGCAGQAPDVRDASDREKGATRGCAMMMKIRIA